VRLPELKIDAVKSRTSTAFNCVDIQFRTFRILQGGWLPRFQAKAFRLYIRTFSPSRFLFFSSMPAVVPQPAGWVTSQSFRL
jgi:hypothetical protein